MQQPQILVLKEGTENTQGKQQVGGMTHLGVLKGGSI